MNSTKVYIFNKKSKGAAYGIGTYISQLTKCLNKSCIDFEIVSLNSIGNELFISDENGYQEISIPGSQYDTKYYMRNISYLLDNFIPKDKKTKVIFHINFMTNSDLIENLKKRFNCKIILTCHYTDWSMDLLGDENRLLSIINKKYKYRTDFEKNIIKRVEDDIKMIKKCDHLVCVAQHTLSTFMKISNIENTKCTVINNALKDTYKEKSSEKRKTLRKKYFIKDSTQIIFFAGRLDEVKGISSLLKSFKTILKTNPDTHLILAGDGDYNRWLKEADGYWTKISFTGMLNKKKLTELFQIADIGVISSIHEEFGYVAIEMMMHKIPVIVGDTGGLSEIIEDNISGLKVPIRTKYGVKNISHIILAEKIDLLLNDKSFAYKIAEAGRNRFLERYEISLFKHKILNLYQTI